MKTWRGRREQGIRRFGKIGSFPLLIFLSCTYSLFSWVFRLTYFQRMNIPTAYSLTSTLLNVYLKRESVTSGRQSTSTYITYIETMDFFLFLIPTTKNTFFEIFSPFHSYVQTNELALTSLLLILSAFPSEK